MQQVNPPAEAATIAMGLVDRLRQRRQQARVRQQNDRAAAQVQQQASAYEVANAQWTAEDVELAEMIGLAQDFDGIGQHDEMSGAHQEVPVLLHVDERAFLIARGVALIEPRRGASHYEGGTSGVSIRIAKGVRYRVGQNRGTLVQGTEQPVAIDTGSFTVTNRRAVFQGSKDTREWDFRKLIGITHDPVLPWTSLQVSNRQKVSGVLYDQKISPNVRFRLTLALAHFQDQVPQLILDLQQQREAHAQSRPTSPARPALPAQMPPDGSA